MESETRVRGQAETRLKIIEVAARLLQEHGPSALTTRGVALSAGVQAPTIYRLFGDKNGLLNAVAEQVMARFVSAKRAADLVASSENMDPLEELRAGWNIQIDFGLANPMLFTLLSVPGHGLHSPAAQAGLEVLRSRVRRVALSGRLRVSEPRAVDLIRAAGTGAVLTLLSKPAGEVDRSLTESLYDAVMREILVDSPTQTHTAPAVSAISLRAASPELSMLTDAERQLLAEWLDRVIEAR